MGSWPITKGVLEVSVPTCLVVSIAGVPLAVLVCILATMVVVIRIGQ